MSEFLCKYYKQKKQVSYDGGYKWYDVTPPEYRKGELYEWDSIDCEDTPPDPSFSANYLTFTVIGGVGRFKLNDYNGDVSYSLDSGSTWESGDTTPMVTSGSKVLWKGNMLVTGTFSASTDFTVEGNVMSIRFGDNFMEQTNLKSDYGEIKNAFASLFSGCTRVKSARNMILPAIRLSTSCYEKMFKNCTGLTTPPYSIGTSGTVMTSGSCAYMFQGCTSLNNITCLATDISANMSIYRWVYGVASSGTFTKAASMTSWPTGDSGIPSGWTIQNA